MSSTKRVLIVCPQFAPLNGADMHRVRMSLPFFCDRGYEALILALDPAATALERDPHLMATLPGELRVWRVSPLPAPATRWFGLRNSALRSALQFLKTGNKIIQEQKIDLVYFSTTMFPLLTLGPYWQRRFGVPFVVDIQDLWYTEYYSEKNSRQPPGGKLKFTLLNSAAKVLEPLTLKRACHIIVVSAAYKTTLRRRYPELSETKFTVLPFGAPELDFAVLGQIDVRQDIFDREDGLQHWVYVGRAGHDMQFALRALFEACRRAQEDDPELLRKLRLHFVGTDYATDDRARKTVEPIAKECGVGDLVSERPQRISYFQTLRCLCDADALIMPGSDDPGYTASKLYPYVLARRPLLAIFHEDSSVISIIESTKAGVAVSFNARDSVASVRDHILQSWFSGGFRDQPRTDWRIFEQFTARQMANRQFDVFDSCSLAVS